MCMLMCAYYVDINVIMIQMFNPVHGTTEYDYKYSSYDLLHTHNRSHNRDTMVENQIRRSMLGNDTRNGFISKGNI